MNDLINLYYKYFETRMFCIEHELFVDKKTSNTWKLYMSGVGLYYYKYKKKLIFKNTNTYEIEDIHFKKIRRNFRIATELEKNIVEAKELLNE